MEALLKGVHIGVTNTVEMSSWGHSIQGKKFSLALSGLQQEVCYKELATNCVHMRCCHTQE